MHRWPGLSVSMTRLPPLKAIEAFVEVARSLNFTRAGAALNITTSAVSRRIRALEEDLGVPLLKRGPNAVRLTETGEHYYESVAGAFAVLHRASADVHFARERRRLRVLAPESFLSIWLIPRLARFHHDNPDLELQLDSLRYFEPFTRNDTDVAIKVARVPPPGHAQPFMALTQFPVIAPALLTMRPLRSLDDFAQIPALELTTAPDAWRDWLEAVGRPDIAPKIVASFDTMGLVMDAAISGLGAALGFRQLCATAIDEGTLVAPLAETVTGRTSLFFVCREEDAGGRSIRRFRDWVMREAATEM
jgi:LysR family glycine cleavage system transcriptional activator